MPYPPPGIIDSIDQIVPAGSFTSPAPGNVSGVVTLTVSASDYDQVASVQFQIDGVNIGSPDTNIPYSTTYDTRALLNGPHTFQAIVKDRVGNSFTTSVAVTFANAPIVVITAPANGANVTGNTSFTATITSYDASVSSQFKVDGANYGAAQPGTGSVGFGSVDTRGWLNGSHTWSVLTTDGHGNTATASITVTHVNNPVVAITAPGNGATLSGNIALSATVTSYDASVATQFQCDGVAVGAPQGGTAPSIASFDTRSRLNGSHTISIYTNDSHGNVATASITVTFANLPVVTITSPTNAGTYGGTFAYTATVTHYDNSCSTQFKIDGALFGATQSGAGSLSPGSPDTRSWLNGSHTLAVTSTDGHGNATTTSITVTFNNAPVVTITAPGNGANVVGSWNYTASITSYDATCSTQFKIDGANFGAAQGGSGGLGFSGQDSRAYLNGSHTLAVTSTDGHGNAITATITVTFKNPPTVTITSPANGGSYPGTWTYSATITSYDASVSSQFFIDGSNTYNVAGAGVKSYNFDSHLYTAAAHTFQVISTDGHGNTGSSTVTATVTNSLPGSGKLSFQSMLQWDGDAYYIERIDVPGYDQRYSWPMIWQATGDLTTPLYLPGNPDPTHYQMYIIQNTDYTEGGTDGVVIYIDLFVNGTRYGFWQNGPLYGDVGSVLAVGGGDSIHFEYYSSYAHWNNCWCQGVGVRYWFGYKSGFNS